MIIRKKTGKPVIDLTGPEGNAFVLLGHAAKFAKLLGLDQAAILAEMKNGDYENLISVFEKHFGKMVTIER